MVAEAELTEAQKETLLETLRIFRRVQAFYWERIDEFRRQLAETVRVAWEIVEPEKIKEGTAPPWFENQEEREFFGDDAWLAERERELKEIIDSVIRAMQAAADLEKATDGMRAIAGAGPAWKKRGGRRPDRPEVVVGYMAKRAGIPVETVQQVIDEAHGAREPGTLARKIRSEFKKLGKPTDK